MTLIVNTSIDDDTHTSIDEAIEDHLVIEEFLERIAENVAGVDITIFWGLGRVASDGIIYTLAQKLSKNPKYKVRVLGFDDWAAGAAIIASSDPAREQVIIGHSLGGSVAPLVAKQAKRPIALIYGFDPADNLAANISQYRLTPVPPNVRAARSVYIPGGALGGGMYEAA